ncbi:hypothetical protein B4135_4197 [Caldibacillus debilis]|uniref:Uncharacterized protein n=1 Tax=Caldibacillus debilis TaxID=301148 RepID=A0A150L6Z9_9BACI|nr:hypothetical protein B4135_4197 [Caldibacillus debilis]
MSNRVNVYRKSGRFERFGLRAVELFKLILLEIKNFLNHLYHPPIF